MEMKVVNDPALPGIVLMDEDQRLLEEADRGNLVPTLRLYEWNVPTISLGYHQDANVLDEGRLSDGGMPWVRRPTGGAAVLHSEELTYAIIIPLPHSGLTSSHVQELASKAIADGLRAIGVPADVDARGEPLSSLPNRTSCFVRTSRWEVTSGGRKIVGSAQRKLPNAILQHGSILIGNDHLRIADFLKLPCEQDRELLRRRLREKATCASDAAEGEIAIPKLRAALGESFPRLFSEISKSANLTSAPFA
jgi:lipoyl(octanoyl) transferase